MQTTDNRSSHEQQAVSSRPDSAMTPWQKFERFALFLGTVGTALGIANFLSPRHEKVELTNPSPLAHLHSIRAGYEPLIYKLEFAGIGNVSHRGFLSLPKTKRAFFYDLSVANLSEREMVQIDLTITSGPKEDLWLGTNQLNLIQANGKAVGLGEWLQRTADELPLRASVARIPSRKAVGLQLIVIADEKPETL